jgi:hypothetical protein
VIDRSFAAEYLDPLVWSRLERVLRPYRNYEKQIFACTDAAGHITMNEEGESRAKNTAVIRYSFEGMKSYFQKIERMDFIAAHPEIDDYLSAISMELCGTAGIEAKDLCRQRMIQRELDEIASLEDGAVLLWITDQDLPYFHCIFRVQGGKLTLVTTADRYGQNIATAEQCCECMQEEFTGRPVVYDFSLEEWDRHLDAEKN